MAKIDERERRMVNVHTDEGLDLGHQLIFETTRKYIENKKVLDIGCWTGQYAGFAKDIVKKFVGIDPGERAIKIANNLYRKNKNLSFKKGVAEKLGFADKSFDVVLMLEVIEHLPKGLEPDAIKEVARVVKKGGTFILSTPNNNLLSILMDPAYFLIGHRHYSAAYLSDLLSEHGFRVVKTYHKGGVFRGINSNLALVYKHLLKRKYQTPKWLRDRIIKEHKLEGFAGIIVVAKRK